MPRSNFSTPPARDLILKAVQGIGFNTLEDTHWTDESHINNTTMAEVVERARQYYVPCVAKQYLDKTDWTYKDYLTIVRQLLKTIGYKLKYKDTCVRVDTRIYKYIFKYQIERPAKALEKEIIVFFEEPVAKAG